MQQIDLLKEFDVTFMQPVSSPLDPIVELSLNDGDAIPNPMVYRNILGKLNYLTHTRPDLAFTVQHLRHFMKDPRVPHLTSTLHVLRYLSKEPGLGLFLNASSSFEFLSFCNSVWGTCPNLRKSISGFYISLGGSPISWKSKKQTFISLSFDEAEYHSIRRMVSKLTWLARLFQYLSIPISLSISLHSESQADTY
ncbi:secreted RxLR effector protein 161-like [Capsicum annuum]|uniref:secreted RxLR effector protein 161-like n=1 Tax=Capsicum annuum TaxID=4072 RepID=UPI001FB0D834|nr:secreted RxLR effector protein 161-like [Capsicum annuum]